MKESDQSWFNMTSSKFSTFLLICLCAICLVLTPSLAEGCLPVKPAALFIFGDSLLDAGNNNYINTTTQFQANYEPYGETFFRYPTGRFSDGRNLPDFIAEYAKLPLIPPYLHPGHHRYMEGVNFASAGAGALVETYQGMVIDLNAQLRYFEMLESLLKKQLGDAKVKELLSRAVYLISIGSNDYLALVSTNASVPYSPPQYVDMVIGNFTTAIKGMYEKGGRKFGFFSLAALGCFPGSKVSVNISAGTCLEEASEFGKLHNNALSQVLKKLERQLIGFKYSLMNLNDLFTELIDYPSKYGFKVGDTACCGSGPYRGYYTCGGRGGIQEYELCENASEYVFFDSFHPTERANQLIAQLAWSGDSNITRPFNLKQLFEL